LVVQFHPSPSQIARLRGFISLGLYLLPVSLRRSILDMPACLSMLQVMSMF